MGKGKGPSPMNQSVSRHHPFRRCVYLLHPKVMAAVLHKNVVLLESTGIKQQVDALPGCQLTRAVLLRDLFFSPSLSDLFLFLKHLLKLCFFAHDKVLLSAAPLVTIQQKSNIFLLSLG